MANLGVYATADEVKEYLENRDKDELVQDDNILLRFAVEASRKFDALTHRRFYPTLQTRTFDDPLWAIGNRVPRRVPVRSSTSHNSPLVRPGIGPNLRPGQLKVDEDLLEVVTLTTANGLTTIDAADQILQSGNNTNRLPADRIVLKSDGTTTIFTFSGTPQEANSVTGFWGFHNDWANAWSQVDTVQDNPLTSSATSVLVTDVDGIDEVGIAPRFREQNLIRFGAGASAEYSYVIDVNPHTEILTVIRGVNGTAAAEQVQNTDIYVFRPQPEITLALKVLATHSYRRKDSVGNAQDRTLASSTGVLILPSTLPDEVASMIGVYRKSARSR